MSIDILTVLLSKFLREPVIITSTRSQHVEARKTVALTVAAVGYPHMTYQWKKNGVVITSADNCSLLLLKNVTAVDAGAYTCTVTNKYGSVVSPICNIDVHALPIILVQPTAVEIDEGAQLTLSVTASGSLPLSYQWQKNGSNVIGAIASTYTKPVSEVSDTGFYSCKVTNQYGSVNSASVSVVVNETGVAPTIDVQPQGASIFVGDTFSLAIVASGTAPLTYQWKKGADNIVGATESTYTVENAQLTDAGSYTCVVTNSEGSATSDAAVVAVQGVAPTITSITPYEVWQDLGTNFELAVVVSGTGPFTYQWRRDNTGTVNDTNEGIVDIEGATSSTYAVTNAQGTACGFYSCKVTSAYGEAISSTVLVGIGYLPMIIVQPMNATVDERQTLLLYCEARGNSMKYQWLKDGVALNDFIWGGLNYDGTVVEPYVGQGGIYKKAVEITESGSYTCVCVNALGSGVVPPENPRVHSKISIVTVNEIGFAPEIIVQPVGVQVAQPGITITNNQTGSANPGQNGQNNYYYEPGTCVMDMSADGQYQVVMNNERLAFISSDYGASWVRKWTGNWGTKSVSMSANGQYLSSFNYEGRGTFTSSDYGATWTLRTNSIITPYNRASSMDHSGQYRLVQCSQGDASAGAWLSKDYGVTWTKVLTTGGWGGTAISANGQYMFVVVAGVGLWRSSDYGTTWTKLFSDTGNSRSLAVSYNGQYIMWGLYGSKIYSNSNYGSGNWQADGALLGNYRRVVMSIDGKIRAGIPTENTTGPIYLSRDFGVTYSALPNSSGKDWTDIAMSVDGTRVTGVLTNGSIYVYTIYENQVSFTLSLTAIGTPPLSYQWEKEGVVIPGATLYYYYKQSAQVTDLGNYTCVVTNNYGNVESNVAVVEVGSAPA